MPQPVGNQHRALAEPRLRATKSTEQIATTREKVPVARNARATAVDSIVVLRDGDTLRAFHNHHFHSLLHEFLT